MPMNYRNADLNLLKVFEALMIEGNVTRTADKLSLTQPTVSNALRRLRETYDDPLFVRSGAGVRPTRRALELWSPLSRSLRSIRGTLEGESFDALHSDARVTVSMTDYVACIAGPRLFDALARLAPEEGTVAQAPSRGSLPLSRGSAIGLGQRSGGGDEHIGGRQLDA